MGIYDDFQKQKGSFAAPKPTPPAPAPVAETPWYRKLSEKLGISEPTPAAQPQPTPRTTQEPAQPKQSVYERFQANQGSLDAPAPVARPAFAREGQIQDTTASPTSTAKTAPPPPLSVYEQFETEQELREAQSAEATLQQKQKARQRIQDLFTYDPVRLLRPGATPEKKTKLSEVPGIAARTGVAVVSTFPKLFTDPEVADQFNKGLVTGIEALKGAVKRAVAAGTRNLPFGTEGDKRVAAKLDLSAEKNDELVRVMSEYGGLEISKPGRFADKIQDPEWIASGLGMNLPNLAASMGIGLTTAGLGAPAVVVGGSLFTVTGLIEAGSFLSEAENLGLDKEKAEKAALFVGVANGVLESLPIMRLLGSNPIADKIKGKILGVVAKEILLQAASEGVTESIQEITVNAAMMVLGEERELLEGTPEAAFFGSIFGFLSGSGNVIVRTPGAPGGVTEQQKEEPQPEPLGPDVPPPGEQPPLGPEPQSEEGDATALKTTPPQSTQEVVDRYREQIIEPATKEGQAVIIDPDKGKPLFGGDFAPENHKFYSQAAVQLFEESLKTVENPVVRFIAGGPGSGKTNFLLPRATQEGFDGIVFDTTFADYKFAKKMFDLAEAAGKQVEMTAIIPDLKTARFYSLKRAAEGTEKGRSLTDDFFAERHSQAPDAFLRLIQEGKDLGIVDIRRAKGATELTRQLQNPVATDQAIAILKEVLYTKDEIIEIIKDVTYEQSTTDTRNTEGGVPIPGGSGPDSAGGPGRGTRPVSTEDAGPEPSQIIATNTKNLRQIYAKADGAQAALDDLRLELELSEPGERTFAINPDYTTTPLRSPSTFPKWVSPENRSKDLFLKVFDKLASVEAIAFPTGARTRQRNFYNELLQKMDERLGVDTTSERRAILEAYGDETTRESATTATGERVADRGATAPTEGEAALEEFGFDLSAEPEYKALAFQSSRAPESNIPAKKGLEYDKVIKRNKIAKDLSRRFVVPIRRGRFRRPGAAAIFYSDTKIIRYKSGGLPTIFHEMGHFLDDKMEFFKYFMGRGKNITERDALMVEYGNGEMYKNQPKTRSKEATAEFIRWYYSGERTKALKAAPGFYAVWEKRMEELPEIRDVLDQAAADYARWLDMPSVAKVQSQISTESDDELQTFGERVTEKWHRLFEMSVDDLHPIEEFTKQAKKRGVTFNSEEDPYVLARLTRGWQGKAEAFLEKGTFGRVFWKTTDGKTVLNTNGKSLREILKPLEDKGALGNFSIYLVARRANELSAREKPIQSGINKADANMAVSELETKYKDFPAKAEELYAYQDRLLDYGKDSGLYEDDLLKKIRQMNRSYVPFFRVFEELESRGYMGRGFGNVRNNLKKIKGSDREIVNPLESIVKNTYAIINAAERNNVMLAMARLAQQDSELGRLFTKIDRPQQATAVNVKEVLDAALGGKGIREFLTPDTQETLDSLDERIVNIFRPSFIARGDTITVLVKGKPQFFEVQKDLLRAVQALDIESAGILVKMLSYPAKFLRAGATLSPDFIVRNPARDQLTAAIFSKYNYIPGVDLARGMFGLVTQDSDYWLWRMGGGEHAAMVSLDREYLQKSIEQVISKRGNEAIKDAPLRTLLKAGKNPLRALQIMSEFGEAGTRIGEMKKALKAQKSPIEAAFAAREVTLDFARIGSKTRAWNLLVAFWNANVQGNEKMIREFKRNPKATTVKALIYLTIPSILLYMANRDDPRWKEIPQWQKDLFWIVLTDENIYRIPKPFVIGQIFASMPERILEYIDNDNPQIFESLWENIVNGVSPGVIPTFALPYIEDVTNHSFFLDRQIVPESREDLPAEAQYGTYTSEFSKEVGQIIKYSPAKIDNYIKGYFAALGSYTVDVIDKILIGTGITNPVPRPQRKFEDLPVIKSFMISEPIGSRSQSLNEFYEEANRAQAASNYYNELLKKGEGKKAMEFRSKNPIVDVGTYFAAVREQLSTISSLKRVIMEHRTLSPAEKSRRIDALDRQMTHISERALRIRFKQ